MKYNKTILLKNGKECCLRDGIESDGVVAVSVVLATKCCKRYCGFTENAHKSRVSRDNH